MIEIKEFSGDLSNVTLAVSHRLPEGNGQTIAFTTATAVATAGETVNGLPFLAVKCGEEIISYSSLTRPILVKEGGEIKTLSRATNWSDKVNTLRVANTDKSADKLLKILNDPSNGVTKVNIQNENVVGLYKGAEYPRVIQKVTLAV